MDKREPSVRQCEIRGQSDGVLVPLDRNPEVRFFLAPSTAVVIALQVVVVRVLVVGGPCCQASAFRLKQRDVERLSDLVRNLFLHAENLARDKTGSVPSRPNLRVVGDANEFWCHSYLTGTIRYSVCSYGTHQHIINA